MGAVLAERDAVSAAVVEALRRRGPEMSVANLAEALSGQANPRAVKAAVWRLLSRGVVEMTLDWKVRLIERRRS